MLGNCEICGCYWNLEEHHMLPGSNRKHCNEDGLTMWICRPCHNALHADERELLFYKKEAERRYLKNHTLDEWFSRYTKNYLELDEIEAIENEKEVERLERMLMNRITIIGNLTKDPELRTTPNGKTVCNFSVAVKRKFKDETQFFRVATFGSTAESCSRNLTKGKKVAVVGELVQTVYEGRNGEKRYSLDVNAEEVEFLSPKELPKSDVNGNNEPPYDPNIFKDVSEDDIPF